MRRGSLGTAGERGAPSMSDAGFTLVELMAVVLIIGILIAIGIPVFHTMARRAQTKTCYANQRAIESAVVVWGVDATQPVSALAGVVNASSLLVSPQYLKRAPRCPAAPDSANPGNPTPAEGAYSLGTSGDVLPCVFGDPQHGSFLD